MKNKQILMVAAFMTLIALSTAGAVYAWFTAQSKVQGIDISTTNSGLLINGVNEWSAGMVFENLAPGWSSEPINFTVKSLASGTNKFELKARLLFAGMDFKPLDEVMTMAIVMIGDTAEPDFQTLKWWGDTGKVLGEKMVGDEERQYQLLFKLPSTAGNEIQNKMVSLSVLLTGTQVL